MKLLIGIIFFILVVWLLTNDSGGDDNYKKEKKIIAQLLLLEQIQLTDDMIKGKKLVIDCMDYCDSISSILKKLKLI